LGQEQRVHLANTTHLIQLLRVSGPIKQFLDPNVDWPRSKTSFLVMQSMSNISKLFTSARSN